MSHLAKIRQHQKRVHLGLKKLPPLKTSKTFTFPTEPRYLEPKAMIRLFARSTKIA